MRGILIAALCVGVLVAALVALGSREEGARTAAPDDAALVARVSELEQRLAQEVESRRALALAVDALASRLAQEGTDAANAASSAPGAAAPEAPVAEAPPPRPGRVSGFGFDPGPLLAAGFAERDVEAYAARVADIEMRRLYLSDQARREGWMGTPRYAEERRALFQELLGTREEFGEEMYDWALYSSGHPNRVQLTDVIEGSPADEAGLQAGDVLVRYAEVQVLTPQELQELTSQGQAGELTPADVQRGDEEIRVYLPRGPLGVRIESVPREPEPAR